MKPLLKLIRWPNLLMILATMYLVRHVLIPSFNFNYVQIQHIHEFYYFLMAISTAMVAAAGYIINDIVDLDMDKINRPRRYVLQRKISVENARKLYYVLNALSLFMISVVCIVNHMQWLILIHVISIMLLWLYSTKLKCQPFIGNVTISFLTAIVPIV